MHRHALSLALPVSLSLLLGACGNGESAQPTIRPAMVVQPQPAADAVDTYAGEVRARYEPDLAFRIGGKITRRLVEVGDRVKKDQPLAELDPQDVRLQLEATRAQVAAAEANLQLVRAERDRYRTLLERKLISQSQFDNVENQYRAGEARLKQIKAEYNVASNQADYAVLRASQDGVIASRRAEVGQVVAAGQTVFSLAADGEREVLISLPEHAIERFKVDQPVAVELWSQPGRQLPARIRELAPAADQQSRTFAARSELIRSVYLDCTGVSERAAALLREEPLSVREVSEMLGFTSPAYFSTAFRKQFGQSPGEYRKSARNEKK